MTKPGREAGGLFHIPDLRIIDGDALAVGEFAVCSRHGSGISEVLGGRVVHAVAEKHHMASGGAVHMEPPVVFSGLFRGQPIVLQVVSAAEETEAVGGPIFGTAHGKGFFRQGSFQSRSIAGAHRFGADFFNVGGEPCPVQGIQNRTDIGNRSFRDFSS